MAAPRQRVVRQLTGEQIAQFHREGFLALDRITTAADVARIRRLLDGLFARAPELPRGMVLDLGDVKHHTGAQRIPQINNTLQFEPRLRQTHYFRNAERLAKQLLGANAAYPTAAPQVHRKRLVPSGAARACGPEPAESHRFDQERGREHDCEGCRATPHRPWRARRRPESGGLRWPIGGG